MKEFANWFHCCSYIRAVFWMRRLQILLLYLYKIDVVLCGIFFTSKTNNPLLPTYFTGCSFFCSIRWNMWQRVNSSISWWKKLHKQRDPSSKEYFYVQMYVYLVQNQVFHTGSAIFHVTSSAYSTCSGLAFGRVFEWLLCIFWRLLIGKLDSNGQNLYL